MTVLAVLVPTAVSALAIAVYLADLHRGRAHT